MTSPGISTVGACVISCSISAIGNSGARSAGRPAPSCRDATAAAAARGDRAARCTTRSGSGPGASTKRVGGVRGHAGLLRVTGAVAISRTSAVGSSARTSASPTRTASKPAAATRRGVVGRTDRRLRDRDHLGREHRRQAGRDAEVLGERREVAAVDADDVRARAQRPLDLARVVRLDEHAEAERDRERVQVGEQRVVGDRGDDQQDRVGADGARLVDLHLVDREVLAQARQASWRRARPAGRRRCRRSTGWSVSTESATAPPASYAFAVGPGIEVGREVALRRRPALQLADRPRPGRRPGAAPAVKSRVGGASSAVLRSRSRVCG